MTTRPILRRPNRVFFKYSSRRAQDASFSTLPRFPIQLFKDKDGTDDMDCGEPALLAVPVMHLHKGQGGQSLSPLWIVRKSAGAQFDCPRQTMTAGH